MTIKFHNSSTFTHLLSYFLSEAIANEFETIDMNDMRTSIVDKDRILASEIDRYENFFKMRSGPKPGKTSNVVLKSDDKWYLCSHAHYFMADEESLSAEVVAGIAYDIDGAYKYVIVIEAIYKNDLFYLIFANPTNVDCGISDVAEAVSFIMTTFSTMISSSDGSLDNTILHLLHICIYNGSFLNKFRLIHYDISSFTRMEKED